jgi:predicted regulator of Ras-like GTPase activity (Roadblock/LC7/MglB family)
MEVSSQVQAAVVLERGEVVATTLRDHDRGQEFGRAARRLLEAATRLETRSAAELEQLAVATNDGSVLAVRNGERVVAATTAPAPTVALVLYDLKTCLRALDQDVDEAR